MKIWFFILLGVFALAALFVYLAPSLIAFRNEHPKRIPIFLLNFFLGFTLLGWIAALLWATAPAPSEQK